MSEFGILDSQYRLIESRFLDDWVIFKALEVSTERVVVIRTPNQRLKADHTRFESFRIAVSRLPTSEGMATRYFPAGTIDQHEYVVSTWIGTTLQTLLDAEDTLSVAYSLELLEQGLAALSTSQNEGFVHGRLTPACFGIAGDRLILDRLVLDTQIQEAIYAPPEVVGAVSLADGRSDIYALGVMDAPRCGTLRQSDSVRRLQRQLGTTSAARSECAHSGFPCHPGNGRIRLHQKICQRRARPHRTQ